jgi:hypothetical protein
MGSDRSQPAYHAALGRDPSTALQSRQDDLCHPPGSHAQTARPTLWLPCLPQNHPGGKEALLRLLIDMRLAQSPQAEARRP